MALNKILFVIFATVFFFVNYAAADENKSCPPIAEKASPEVTQSLTKSPRDRGFLWRISKDGHSSFLYGTIHVAKYEWTFPGPKIIQALSASDTVALELDMLDEEVQRKLSKGISGFHSSALPAELENRIRRQADALCISYDAIAMLSPEFQVETLTLMVGTWEKLYASYSIDGVLAGFGHAAKKKVVSLETPESQLELLQMKNAQETIALVQDSLEELESGSAHVFLGRIAKIWENADYAEMSRFNEWCDCLKTKIERDMMKRLLEDRNPKLADRIEALHESGKNVFAAVGTLHMFGSNGLPTLLKIHGYHIELIELNKN